MKFQMSSSFFMHRVTEYIISVLGQKNFIKDIFYVYQDKIKYYITKIQSADLYWQLVYTNKMFNCFTDLQYSVTSVHFVFTTYNLFLKRFSLPNAHPSPKQINLKFFK
jgi:hypothetical protein